MHHDLPLRLRAAYTDAIPANLSPDSRSSALQEIRPIELEIRHSRTIVLCIHFGMIRDSTKPAEFSYEQLIDCAKAGTSLRLAQITITKRTETATDTVEAMTQ